MVLPRVDPEFNREYVDNLFAQANKKFLGSGGTYHGAYFVYYDGSTIYDGESAQGSENAWWDLDWRTDEYRIPDSYSEQYKNRVITEGFSWGKLDYAIGESIAPKTMYFPYANRVSAHNNNLANPTNFAPTFASDDDGTPTSDQDNHATALIYTVCKDSFVLIEVRTDLSSQPDSVDILFKPRPQSYFDDVWAAHKDASDRNNYLAHRKYPSQFEGWMHIGTTNENWSGSGDNTWTIGLPCKAGAKFAFFRSIFAYSSNLKVTKNSDGVVTGVSSVGMDKIFPGPAERDKYSNGETYTEGKLTIPFNLKLSDLQTQYADLGWNTASSSSRPTDACVVVREMPMYA